MASLIENLISDLKEISLKYENLLSLSMKKTPIIVAGDLESLALITEEEQNVVNKVNRLDQSIQATIKDIANVINKDVKDLKLLVIIDFLNNRPAEQAELAAVYDKLHSIVHNVASVNQRNSELIRNALEMVEFDMNVIQAMKVAPETANYNRGAYNTGGSIGVNAKKFDAKQ